MVFHCIVFLCLLIFYAIPLHPWCRSVINFYFTKICTFSLQIDHCWFKVLLCRLWAMHKCHLLHFLLLVFQKEMLQNRCCPLKPQTLPIMDIPTKLVLQAAGFHHCSVFLHPSDQCGNFLSYTDIWECRFFLICSFTSTYLEYCMIKYCSFFSCRFETLEDRSGTSVEASNLWWLQTHWFQIAFIPPCVPDCMVFFLRWLQTHWLILKTATQSLVPVPYIDVPNYSQLSCIYDLCNSNECEVFSIILSIDHTISLVPYGWWRLFVSFNSWLGCSCNLSALFLLDQSICYVRMDISKLQDDRVSLLDFHAFA